MNQVHSHQHPYSSADMNSQLTPDFNPSPTDSRYNMDPYHHQQHQHQQQQQQQQQQQHQPQQQTYYPQPGQQAGLPQPRLPLPSNHVGQQPPPPMGYYGHGNPQQLPTPGVGGSRAASIAGPPQQLSLSDDKYKYTLKIEQQPQRARMCGFGDKDRRPLTPPPCVRLIITDIKTGREVDVNEIGEDGSFYVLQVDLWNEHGDLEANTVRASSSSPAVSISTAITTSFPPPEQIMMDQRMAFTGQQMYYPPGMHRPPMGGPPMPGSQYSSPMYYPQPNGGYAPVPPQHMHNPQAMNMMYTRNLIGSLTVNASRLNDIEGKSGYWFVLQDLSVRTEGFFRLKMNFVNLGRADNTLNRGSAPVLASIFSDKFQVYSAKKFPGVIESTPLSKCFAGQGIKIPIRKDMKNETKEEDEGDDF
ncbi:Hypothetical protein R9X50_00399400 [Acrodontium crateriforme]|uniref:Velvet domain-containing protein n=1 Tax=Acrodontium crateriforme TaxID=150365 RepID=A0AAQ3M3Z6_9PEZI|nr:Hypothetical protein R9X50_00399400 [Acrodontium crateriforme]